MGGGEICFYQACHFEPHLLLFSFSWIKVYNVLINKILILIISKWYLKTQNLTELHSSKNKLIFLIFKIILIAQRTYEFTLILKIKISQIKPKTLWSWFLNLGPFLDVNILLCVFFQTFLNSWFIHIYLCKWYGSSLFLSIVL